MRRLALGLLAVAVLCAACSSRLAQGDPFVSSVVPSPGAAEHFMSSLPTPTRRWPTPIGYYTSTLASPKGALTFPLQCSQSRPDVAHCGVVFPNGKVAWNADRLWWSPDDHYAVICHLFTHDSPGCLNGFTVWDMVGGQSFLSFPDDLHTSFKWAPAGHVLAYYSSAADARSRGRIVLYDFDTAQWSYPDVCPAWLFSHDQGQPRQPDEDAWRKICSQLLSATPRPGTPPVAPISPLATPSSTPIALRSPLPTPALPTPTVSPLVNVGNDVAEALARSPTYLELAERGDLPFKVAPSPIQAGAKLPELAVFYIQVLKDKGGTPAPLSSLVAVAFYREKNGIYERAWEHPADVENPQIGHPTDRWPWVRPYFEAFDISGDGRTEVMAAGCGNGNKCYYRASVWSDDGRLLFRLEPDNFTGMQFFSSEHTIVTRTGLDLSNQFPFNPQEWRLDFYNWNGSEYAKTSSRVVPYAGGADPLRVEDAGSGTILVDSAVYASAPGKWDGWSLWSVDAKTGITDEFRWAKALGSLWLLGWSHDEGVLIQAYPDNRNPYYYRVAPDGAYRQVAPPSLGSRPWHPSDPRLLSFDGKNVRVRDASGEHYEQVDISPDGKQIVFAWCNSTTMMCGIYKTPIDGSDLSMLVPPETLEGDKPSRFKMWPRWSPDGTRIAFVTGQSAGIDLSLWVTSADGSQRRRLADTTGEGLGGGFVWSPDSGKLAFLSDRNGIDYMQTGSGKGISRIFPARTHYLYLVDVDGRELARLADIPLVDTSSLLWLPEEAGW